MNVFIWCIIRSLLTHTFHSTLKFLCILNKFWLALILQTKIEFRACLKSSAKCTGKVGMMFLKDLRRELEELAKTSPRTDFPLGVPTDSWVTSEKIYSIMHVILSLSAGVCYYQSYIQHFWALMSYSHQSSCFLTPVKPENEIFDKLC